MGGILTVCKIAGNANTGNFVRMPEMFRCFRGSVRSISKSFNCPLAYIVRKRLRHMGISRGFKVVFSEELPDKDSIVPCEDRNKKSQVGTISYIPAVFGSVCAQAAVQHLMEKTSI